MDLGDSYGRIGGRIAGSWDRHSIGIPTESMNLVPWGSQRLNHQPKSIHGLDLAPMPYVADVQLGLHVGPVTTAGVGRGELTLSLLPACRSCSPYWVALSDLSGRRP